MKMQVAVCGVTFIILITYASCQTFVTDTKAVITCFNGCENISAVFAWWSKPATKTIRGTLQQAEYNGCELLNPERLNDSTIVYISEESSTCKSMLRKLIPVQISQAQEKGAIAFVVIVDKFPKEQIATARIGIPVVLVLRGTIGNISAISEIEINPTNPNVLSSYNTFSRLWSTTEVLFPILFISYFVYAFMVLMLRQIRKYKGHTSSYAANPYSSLLLDITMLAVMWASLERALHISIDYYGFNGYHMPSMYLFHVSADCALLAVVYFTAAYWMLSALNNHPIFTQKRIIISTYSFVVITTILIMGLRLYLVIVKKAGIIFALEVVLKVLAIVIITTVFLISGITVYVKIQKVSAKNKTSQVAVKRVTRCLIATATVGLIYTFVLILKTALGSRLVFWIFLQRGLELILLGSIFSYYAPLWSMIKLIGRAATSTRSSLSGKTSKDQYNSAIRTPRPQEEETKVRVV